MAGDSKMEGQKQISKQTMDDARKDVSTLIEYAKTDPKRAARFYYGNIYYDEKEQYAGKRKNLEYDKAYREAWGALSATTRGQIDKALKNKPEAHMIVQSKTPEQRETERDQAAEKAAEKVRSWMKEHGFDTASLILNGSQTTSTSATGTSSYDGIIDFKGPNKRIMGGYKGVSEKTTTESYAQSYEFFDISSGNDKARNKKEVEAWLKNGIASLGNDGAFARLGSLRGVLQKDNVDCLAYISGESGIASFWYAKREGDNSASVQMTGNPNYFSLMKKKVEDKEFGEYSTSMAVFQSVGPFQRANTIGNFVADKSVVMMYGKGNIVVSLGGLIDENGREYDLKENYTGGTLKIQKLKDGSEIRMALSSPYIEKRPDGNPEIFVMVYLLKYSKKKGKMEEEFIGKQPLPVFGDPSSIMGSGWEAKVSVAPSADAFDPIKEELAKQNYQMSINNSVIPIMPSINPTYLFHNPKDNMDYKVTIKSIAPQTPIIDSMPRLFAEVEVVNQAKLTEGRTQKIELGKEEQFLVGGGSINMKVELPPQIVMTMNSEKVTENISLTNEAVKSKNSLVNDHILQHVSYNKQTVNIPLIGAASTGVETIALLDRTIAGEEKLLDETTTGTRVKREFKQERLNDLEAVNTVFSSTRYQNIIGLQFNAVNAKGLGLWGVAYNPKPAMDADITKSGDAFYQLTAKTKKIGWDSLGLSGATAFDKGTYVRETENNVDETNRIRSETGAALWHYFDTIALHGEAKTGAEKTTERKTVHNTDIMTSGKTVESTFNAWDRNRSGIQVLTVNYKAEKLSGRETSNAAVVERSNLYYEIGGSGETNNTVVKRIYGGLGMQDKKDLSEGEYTMFTGGKSKSYKEATETALDSWNPFVGFSGRMGAYTLKYTNSTQEDMSRSEYASGITNMTGETKSESMDFIVGALPILVDKLSIDATFSGKRTEQNQKTISTLSSEVLNNSEYLKSEIKPLYKLSDGGTVYARILTQMTKSESDTYGTKWQSGTRTKNKIGELELGYRPKYLELSVNYYVDDQTQITKYLNKLDEVYHFRQTRMGAALSGKLGKDVTYRGSASVSWDNKHNSSAYYNLSMTYAFSANKDKEKEKK